MSESMSLEELRMTERKEMLRLAAAHGARNVRVFGSVARGDISLSSDIDIFVDLDAGRSLMDLGGLLMDLTTLLDAPVEIATENMLRPHIRARALAEAIAL